MKRVSVLDCTLRDGGYCNNWMFGQNNTLRIINGLNAANVEYIECGFLTNRVEYNNSRTKFTEPDQVAEFLPKGNTGKPCLLMINHGEYEAEDLPDCKDTPIDGIRVAFHKKDCSSAIEFCKKVQEKGYLLFVQPMVSLSYSEDEFVTLIHEINKIRPYAFYIVDSFGMMKKKALIQFVELTEMNLLDDIKLGFHAHNNLQLAYSNAQFLVELPIRRDLIIDVSIHGMGRGAGNLNAELFLEHLNETINADYSVRPILNLMDEIVSRFYEEKPWGYSLPNYLSATHLIHPNYATYLDSKKTLTLEAMDEIFSMMNPEKGVEYDEKYIEQLYIDYLSRREMEDTSLKELASIIRGRKVLIIAPGRSVIEQKEKILSFVNDEKPLVFSVNHDNPYINSDYIFVSNMRRFKQLSNRVYSKTIITSNIDSQETYACVKYYRLLNVVEGVRDNAGLMAIKFIEGMGVNEFYLAGYDGYSHDAYMNFESKDMTLFNPADSLDKINAGLKQGLALFSGKYKIHFLTKSIVIPEGAQYLN